MCLCYEICVDMYSLRLEMMNGWMDEWMDGQAKARKLDWSSSGEVEICLGMYSLLLYMMYEASAVYWKRSGGRARVELDPSRHLVVDMQDGLESLVAVAFVWQAYVSALHTMALQSRVHALTLHRKGARVVIILAVNQQHWLANFVRVMKRRHRRIHRGCLPHRAFLRLESERCQGAVVRAGTSNATREEIAGMCEEIRSRESAIRMATDGNARMRSAISRALSTLSVETLAKGTSGQ